jgi:hypothetical protein
MAPSVDRGSRVTTGIEDAGCVRTARVLSARRCG